jgi:hypothetical protein
MGDGTGGYVHESMELRCAAASLLMLGWTLQGGR